MTAAIDIIQAALEKIGEYAPGETITDADAERSLSELNDMLDQWSNENLMTFAMKTQTFTLITNQVQYTIGPSVTAYINSTRPLRIEQAWQVDPEANRYPIEIVEWDVWNSITNQTTNSDVPTTLYYDPQDPIGIINVWPAPLLTWQIGFTSYLQFEFFDNLSEQVVLPRGYVSALKNCLAVEVAPYFGKMVSQDIREAASVAKATVKRKNIRLDYATYDSEIVSRQRESYVIQNDSFSGRRTG